MTKPRHVHVSDLREAARLATTATVGLTDLVEALHGVIRDGPGLLGTPPTGRTRGVTGLVYRGVRGVTRALGSGAEAVLGRLVPLLRPSRSSVEREAVLAALNGVLGDHLEATASPLAIRMEVRHRGQVVPSGGSKAPAPGESRRLLLLVHGLCMNERAWDAAEAPGSSPWSTLERALEAKELRIRYNSGLHVSTNGRRLANLLEEVVAGRPGPVEEIAIVAHSMGGLVARSACHYAAAAGHSWPRLLHAVVFLGTPHHGAPLERIGNLAELALAATPWSDPFARLGKIRSAGITDLRHGSLLDDDWEGHDRFAHRHDDRLTVPLPPGLKCFAIAASAGHRRGLHGDVLFGDGLVPVASALGHHAEPARSLPFPASRTRVFSGMKHLDLLSRPEVVEQVGAWLKAPG